MWLNEIVGQELRSALSIENPADSTSKWSFYRQYTEVALVLEGGQNKKSQGLIFLNLSNFHPNAFNSLLIINLNIINLIIASSASPL